MFNVVLLEPEIPENTGNIGRTCCATGTALHLIDPLGFHLNERNLKRAGMDYWEKLNVTRHINYESFRRSVPDSSVIWMATTKAEKCYTDAEFRDGDYIMFGKESAGIPEEILVENRAHCIRIPMGHEIRSLNLANSAAIVLYEALRQQKFTGLEEKGKLHYLSWKKPEKK